jgi:Outer membrane protein beta-barrel domain
MRPFFCISGANAFTMKKLSLFVSVILLGSAVMAQTSAKIGIKAGLNVANVALDPEVVDKSSRLGFHGGLVAHIHLSPQWGVQPEILYSGQGFEDNTNDAEWKLNYLNIPIMLQYMFDNGFRIQAGPQVGFLLDGKVAGNGGGADVDISNDLKKIDAGLGVGLGYLSYSGFGVEGRYNLGLTNINDVGTNELNNRVFQISLFYMLDNAHKAKSR